MSILSAEFLLLTAAVLVVYYVLPIRARPMALLVGSAVFIAAAGLYSAAHLTAVALLLWLGGLGLEALKTREAAAEEEHGRKRRAAGRKALLALLLVLDLGAMILLKFEPAVASWVNGLREGSGEILPVWALAAPLGLSYFTFQSAGLLIDISRGKAPAQRNPLRAWLFVGYFPQLAQGPISTWKDLGTSLLTGHRLDPAGFVSGFQLMLWGYFKKLVVADRLAATTTALLEDEGALPGWLVLGGVALYAVRLYADFSGGMDVVRGVSRMLGIELPENFRRPFFARSTAEYWRRWHITLGAWFRSYLLYPMANSRAGLSLGRRAARGLGKKTGFILPTALATLLIFLLIGLWHGASWNAVIYGGYFGLLMGASVLLDPVWKKLNKRLKLPKKGWMGVFRLVRTWAIVLLAQYFAFTPDPGKSFALLGQSVRGWSFAGAGASLTAIMPVREWLIAGIGLALLLIVDILCERRADVGERLARGPVWIRWPVLLALLLAVLVLGIYGPGFDGAAFLYTQF